MPMQGGMMQQGGMGYPPMGMGMPNMAAAGAAGGAGMAGEGSGEPSGLQVSGGGAGPEPAGNGLVAGAVASWCACWRGAGASGA